MKTFTFKFDLGERVYLIHFLGTAKRVKCKDCRGKGYVLTYTKRKAICPACHGERRLIKYGPQKWQINSETFKIIHQIVETGKYGIGEGYKARCFGYDAEEIYSGNHLFKTKKQAQKACDELNFSKVEIRRKYVL